MEKKNTSEAKHGNAGKVRSEEHKARIRAALKGKKQSAEHVLKRAQAIRSTCKKKRETNDDSN